MNLTIDRHFWRLEECETLLPNVDNEFMINNPDLIVRTWWGLIFTGNEDKIVETGAAAFVVKEKIEAKRKNDPKFSYCTFPFTPLNYFNPVIGELIYCFQSIKSSYPDYTVDDYQAFMRHSLTLAAHGCNNIPTNQPLPDSANIWINECINNVTPIALKVDQIRIDNGGDTLIF